MPEIQAGKKPEVVKPFEAVDEQPPAPKPERAKYPRYLHIRVAWIPLGKRITRESEDYEIYDKGGFTVCYKFIPDISLLRFTLSRCAPYERYNLARGRAIAANRFWKYENRMGWKVDSNEKRDYVDNQEMYCEMDMKATQHASDLIAKHIEKLIESDRYYQDYELQLIKRGKVGNRFRYVLV